MTAGWREKGIYPLQYTETFYTMGGCRKTTVYHCLLQYTVTVCHQYSTVYYHSILQYVCSVPTTVYYSLLQYTTVYYVQYCLSAGVLSPADTFPTWWRCLIGRWTLRGSTTPHRCTSCAESGCATTLRKWCWPTALPTTLRCVDCTRQVSHCKTGSVCDTCSTRRERNI